MTSDYTAKVNFKINQLIGDWQNSKIHEPMVFLCYSDFIKHLNVINRSSNAKKESLCRIKPDGTLSAKIKIDKDWYTTNETKIYSGIVTWKEYKNILIGYH
jgi:hypothetical protein